MKQVVIKGEFNTNNLLTPYWTKEFLKRKGYKEIYVYESREIGGYDRLVQIENSKLKDYGYYTYNPFHYATTNIDYTIKYEDFIHDYKDYIIPVYKLFKNREDENLIKIVNEINNKDKVKIVEIPDDIKYSIEIGQYNIEYIKEKSREWK